MNPTLDIKRNACHKGTTIDMQPMQLTNQPRMKENEVEVEKRYPFYLNK